MIAKRRPLILLFCISAGVVALAAVFLWWTGSVNSYHVAGPFYLQPPTAWDRDNMTLYRCTDAPECGRDPELPDATIFAAGADSRYVVAARHPRTHNPAGDVTDKSITQYFYFARIKNERYDSEKVVGPLTKAEFEAASAEYHLPPLSIVLDDLK